MVLPLHIDRVAFSRDAEKSLRHWPNTSRGRKTADETNVRVREMEAFRDRELFTYFEGRSAFIFSDGAFTGKQSNELD